MNSEIPKCSFVLAFSLCLDRIYTMCDVRSCKEELSLAQRRIIAL